MKLISNIPQLSLFLAKWIVFNLHNISIKREQILYNLFERASTFFTLWFQKVIKNKNWLTFLFLHFFVVLQKVLWKPLKGFIKPFYAPQRSVKIKVNINFISSTRIRAGRVIIQEKTVTRQVKSNSKSVKLKIEKRFWNKYFMVKQRSIQI